MTTPTRADELPSIAVARVCHDELCDYAPCDCGSHEAIRLAIAHERARHAAEVDELRAQLHLANIDVAMLMLAAEVADLRAAIDAAKGE